MREIDDATIQRQLGFHLTKGLRNSLIPAVEPVKEQKKEEYLDYSWGLGNFDFFGLQNK